MRGLLVLTTLITCGSSAFGFVRSRTQESGDVISWTTRCIPFHVHDQGSDDLPLQQVVDAALDSFDAWVEPACSAVEFYYQGLTNDNRVGYLKGAPNINTVVFRESADDWEHQRGVIAVTTVTYCAGVARGCPFAGAILDADIEMNGGEFTFSDTNDIRRIRFDLRNTLTHEVGHLLGLDHTSVAEATMFPSAPPGEASKSTLHQDDIQGVCDIYPAETPLECGGFEVTGEYFIDLENPPGGDEGGGGSDGCASVDGHGLGLLGLLLLFGVRRRAPAPSPVA